MSSSELAHRANGHGIHARPELLLVADLLGGPRRARLQRADALLRQLGGLERLAEAGYGQLTRAGLAPAEAQRIIAAVEVGRRVRPGASRPHGIHSPHDAHALFWPLLGGASMERFAIAVLDVKNRPKHVEVVATGAIDYCPVDPRSVFRPAVREAGSALLVAHNHPSGDPTPSSEDIALTERLCQAGKVVGIPVLDHLVLGGAELPFRSLAQLGHLPPHAQAPPSSGAAADATAHGDSQAASATNPSSEANRRGYCV